MSDAANVEILLAEDNDDDVVLIRDALSGGAVHIVAVVSDGEEALSYLRREGEFETAPRPQLVVLDIDMPKKNGLDVLDEIKRDPRLCRLPVVILSSSDAADDLNAAYARGASTFITKPNVFEELSGALRRFEDYWSRVARLPAS